VPDEPEEPLDPEEPLVPLDPEDPLVPDDPSLPEVPLDPDDPEEPLVPEDPDDPLVPLDPEEPLVPLDPDDPEIPPITQLVPLLSKYKLAYCESVFVKDPSIVWDDVVSTVIILVTVPLFLTTYILPVIPTAVGSVTLKVPDVQSIK